MKLDTSDIGCAIYYEVKDSEMREEAEALGWEQLLDDIGAARSVDDFRVVVDRVLALKDEDAIAGVPYALLRFAVLSQAVCLISNKDISGLFAAGLTEGLAPLIDTGSSGLW